MRFESAMGGVEARVWWLGLVEISARSVILSLATLLRVVNLLRVASSSAGFMTDPMSDVHTRVGLVDIVLGSGG